MKMNRSKQGFTLVEIMIVVVIIGLLAALAIPAFNKVRETSQIKAITNNLRQVAGAAEQYFMEQGVSSVPNMTAIVGTATDKYIKTITPVAGETYTGLFPLTSGWTQLSVSKSNGVVVTYQN